MPVLTDERNVPLPARTVWERMRNDAPTAPAHFEAHLLSWIRSGLIQLRSVPGAVELVWHLAFTPGPDGRRRDMRNVNTSMPNQARDFRMLKQALMQPPYSFKYDGASKIWTAARRPGHANDQVWDPLIWASEAWVQSPGGYAHEAAFREQLRRDREAREAEQAAADAARAERARAAEARAAEARAAASDRQRLERQGRVQEARERAAAPPPPAPAPAPPPPPPQPRPGDYVRTFGVNPDRAFADSLGNQTLDRRENELNENMVRDEQDSRAQRVALRYDAMRPVRDLVNQTLDAMYDRIQGAYHEEELHPVDDADAVQFEVKTKLEIVEGVKVTLRASTSPSAAIAAQKAGRSDEPYAAIGWSLLFAPGSVERQRVNAGLVAAGYTAVAGNGQVQVRNDNTLNIALNKVWESLDSIRQAAVRAAPAREPPAPDALVAVRQQRTLAARGDNSSEDESEDEATETSEEDESESEAESSDDAYSDGSEDEASAESSEYSESEE